ncbi:MAG: polyprenyl synthetase family protein [Dehalococcoidia bacterium]
MTTLTAPAPGLPRERLIAALDSFHRRLNRSLVRRGDVFDGNRAVAAFLNGSYPLRPLLALAPAAVAGNLGRTAFDSALAIELSHLAGEYHSELLQGLTVPPDMEDGEATLRSIRNAETEPLIMFGDFLAVKSSRRVVSLPKKISRIVAEAFADQYEGLLLGSLWNKGIPTIQEYEEIARRRQGALLAGSARCGAVVAGLSEASANDLFEFGERLGIALDIWTGVLDLRIDEPELERPAGQILMTATACYPLVISVANDLPGRRRLEQWAAAPAAAEVPEIVAILQGNGAPEKALDHMQAHLQLSLDALRRLPEPLADLLEEVATFPFQNPNSWRHLRRARPLRQFWRFKFLLGAITRARRN